MSYYNISKNDIDTWYIREMLGVGCFLFEGSEKALLFDTGFGFRNIRKVIDKLTSKPLVVVNSHGHTDHAGGNTQFPQVYIHSADLKMTEDAWQKNQRDQLIGYARKNHFLARPFLYWLGRSRPHIYDTEYKAIEDGVIFDLGGRRLTVTHFPGHSPGSIILTDEHTQTLYTGDAVNSGLFLFFEGSPKLKEYAERLNDLAQLQGYSKIFDSHSKNPLPISFISHYASFLERATLDKSQITNFPNGEKDVYVYKEEGIPFERDFITVHFTKDLII